MRKGQIQIGETIFIVIFILIIIVFAFVFYSGAKEDETQQTRARFAELESIEKSQIASSLPEIRCTLNGVVKESCFEIERMESFTSLTENNPSMTREHYVSKLGNTRLVVEQIYPKKRTWVLYNNTLGENVSQSGLPVIIPVSLYDASAENYNYGILYVTNFQKTG